MLMSKGDQRVYEGFRLAMVETYGEDFIQDLVEMTRQTKKWSRFELEDILKDVNEQIKFHENRLGGL